MRSIATRITFAAVSITMAVVLALGAASLYFMQRNTATLLQEKLHSESEIISDRLETILAGLEHAVASLAKNQIIVSALIDTVGRESYLAPFMKGFSLPGQLPFRLTLCDFEGKTIAANHDQNGDYSVHPELIRKVVEEAQPYGVLRLAGELRRIMIAYPVFYGATGMAEGFLALEVEVEAAVAAALAKTPLDSEQLLSLTARGEEVWSVSKLPRSRYYLTGQSLSLQGPLARLELAIEYGEQRDKHLALLNKLTMLYLAIGLTVFLLTIIISRALARKLILPLTMLADTADLVAGSGKPATGIEIKGDGEVARLVASINTMLLRLREAQETLEQRVAERTRELAQEVAERKNAENEARQGKEKWEKTFNAIPDIITIQNREMEIVAANQAAHDFLHANPGALQGKHCYQLFRGADTPCANCPELTTFKTLKTRGAIISHQNLGKIFYVSSSPIFDEHGQATHFVHVAKDITQQKKLEEDLFQAHKMEAIGTLAGGIAHDFNNILTAILGYSSLMKEQIAGDGRCAEYSDYLEQVIKGSNRAKELVKQILSFSRKDSRLLEPIDPGPIIKEALKLLRASLPATIEMQIEVDSDRGLILASPTTLHQVVVNLCTNALYAMENQHGVLTVRLARIESLPPEQGESAPKGPFVELSVSDTGKGMDAATRERMFEPYFTTKEFGRGSGMGLSVVHGIVYGCGGIIRVESEPDQGSTFHLYFPRLPEQSLSAPEGEETISLLGRERILVVDDEDFIIGMYQESLKALGYQVTAERSGTRAWELFKADPEAYDLLVTDQTMPGITGTELARKILELRPGFPIILCTGYSSLVNEETALELGISSFLMKPVTGFELAQKIREIFAA